MDDEHNAKVPRTCCVARHYERPDIGGAGEQAVRRGSADVSAHSVLCT